MTEEKHSPIYHEYIHIHAHNEGHHILEKNEIFIKLDIYKMVSITLVSMQVAYEVAKFTRLCPCRADPAWGKELL